jgi:hypothetical protein
MKWQDDPEIQAQVYANRIRSGLIRSAFLWTPFFLLAAGLLIFFLFDQVTGGGKGSWFLVVILAVFSVLLGFQSAQPVLDLRGEPVEGTFVVVRRWSKADGLVMKTHYLQLDNRQILHGDRYILDGIKSEDRVHVKYYPHTGVIVNLEKAPLPKATETKLSESLSD